MSYIRQEKKNREQIMEVFASDYTMPIRALLFKRGIVKMMQIVFGWLSRLFRRITGIMATKKSSSSNSGGLLEDIIVGGASILGGIFLAAALAALADRSGIQTCPVCNAQIQRNSNPCPNCHTPLRWG